MKVVVIMYLWLLISFTGLKENNFQEEVANKFHRVLKVVGDIFSTPVKRTIDLIKYFKGKKQD